jgi:predicted ATPase with chaperone activity
MLAKIYSAAVYGVDAYEVEIEVNIGPGKPVMVIVGLPDLAVKESRDRVWTAIGTVVIDHLENEQQSTSRLPISRRKDLASICRLRLE